MEFVSFDRGDYEEIFAVGVMVNLSGLLLVTTGPHGAEVRYKGHSEGERWCRIPPIVFKRPKSLPQTTTSIDKPYDDAFHNFSVSCSEAIQKLCEE